MDKLLLPILYASAVIGVLLAAMFTRPTSSPSTATPTETRSGEMTLPANYQDVFVQYAIVDRVDGVTRHLYIDAAALEAFEAGQPLPEGTRLIIEAFEASGDIASQRLVPQSPHANIHMAEKRSTWQLEDLATSSRVGDWNFGSFERQSGQHSTENVNDCFTCTVIGLGGQPARHLWQFCQIALCSTAAICP